MGRELREARRRLGLTQEELAERVGVEQSYISMLETASDPNVGWHTLRGLITVLRAKPHQLFPAKTKTREERT